MQYHHPYYIHYAYVFSLFSFWSKIKSRFTHCFWLLCLFGLPQSKTSYHLLLFFLTLNPLKSLIVLKNVSYFRFICFFIHSGQTFLAGTSGDVLNFTLHYIRRHSMTSCPTVGCGKYGHLIKVPFIRSLHCKNITTAFSFCPIVFFFFLRPH